MASAGNENSETKAEEADLRDMSQALLRAIEAEPVPEEILVLARALASALMARQGLETVDMPAGSSSPD